MKILVVDTSKNSRRAVSLYLKLHGYQTFEAGDAPEALKMVDQHDIGLILVDLARPCLDGYSVAHQIRDCHGDIGLIFMAGDQNQRIFPSAAFLVQPFAPEDLMNEIEKQFGAPRRMCS